MSRKLEALVYHTDICHQANDIMNVDNTLLQTAGPKPTNKGYFTFRRQLAFYAFCEAFCVY